MYIAHTPVPELGLNLNVKMSFYPVVIPGEFDNPVTYMNPLGSISKVEAVSYRVPPKFQELVIAPYVVSKLSRMKSP